MHDRSVLVGILALQNELVTRDQFTAALATWGRDRSRALVQVLVEQRILRPQDVPLLEALAGQYLELHGQDAGRVLRALVRDEDLRAHVSTHLAALKGQETPHKQAGFSAPPTAEATLDTLAPKGETQDPSTTHAPPSSAGPVPPAEGVRYRVLRSHARGGLGEVFVALDQELQREVALKEIQAHQADRTEARARFLLEAEVTGRLEHPGIVPVYGLGVYPDGRPYYAMRFIKGESLQAAVKRLHADATRKADRGKWLLELRKLLGRFVDVCNAIAYAHSRGVLHRDLKPDNVMLGDYGETLVVDWGLARVLGDLREASRGGSDNVRLSGAARESGFTQTGDVLGTPSYMSPEQAAGKLGELSPASDVYSLGAILYALFTGRSPFEDRDVYTVLERVRRGKFPPPRRLYAAVPAALEAVCLKAMALRPQDRYASARELSEEVEHWLADEPVDAWPEPLTVRLARWGRRHRSMVTAAAALLLTGLVALGVGYTLLAREQAATREAQIQSVLTANPRAVPALIAELARAPQQVRGRLRELGNRQDLSARQRTRARLALLTLGGAAPAAAELADLRERMMGEAEPEEMLLIRDTLAAHGAALAGSLWAMLDNPAETAPRRFRAAAALAALDSASSRWSDSLPDVVVEQLLADANLATWTQALRPVRRALIKPLRQAFRDPSLAGKAQLAAQVLVDYAADRPEVLADLLADASAEQVAVVFPGLAAHPQRAVALLRAELARVPAPSWPEPQPSLIWTRPSAEQVRQIEAAAGLLADHFAFCQTMPLKRLVALAEALRPCGYRPVNFRPFRRGAETLAAAVWRRDGRSWQMASGLSAAEVKGVDARWRKAGLVPVDVAGYRAEGKASVARFAVLWSNPDEGVLETRLRVDVPVKQRESTREALEEEKFVPRTEDLLAVSGEARYSAVWFKPPRPLVNPVYACGENRAWYEDNLRLGSFQLDVRVSPAPPGGTKPGQLTATLARAQKAVAARPKDGAARMRRARAFFDLGRDREAIEDLTWLVERGTRTVDLFRYRAQAYARTGQAEKARADAAWLQRDNVPQWARAYLDAVVSVYLGEAREAFQRLEKDLADTADDTRLIYVAACVYAVAARRDPGKTAYASRALELLDRALVKGFTDFTDLDKTPDLDALRQDPRFGRLLARHNLDQHYAAVWDDNGGFQSREAHGQTPEEILHRALRLAEQGYRPAAVSVMAPAGDRRLTAATVWHRPVIPAAARDALARRQANAAVGLWRLGQAEQVRPLLKHSEDPRLRTYLIHRLGPLGVLPQALLRGLDTEHDLSVRRALVLSLGEFPAKAFSAAERQSLTDGLLRTYRTASDPGLHAAAGWLLRRWGREEQVQGIDWTLATRVPAANSRWYINGQGQTLTVVPVRGSFRMGSSPAEAGRDARDEPRHRRRIGRSFAIAATEVTVEQYERFLRANPSVGRPDTSRHSPEGRCPTIAVTWYEAARYCNWLSEQEGIPKEQWCYPNLAAIEEGMKPYADYLSRTGYRLPTEAEWELACRAGASTSRFYGEDEALLPRYAWLFPHAADRTRPVGSLKPNDLGLFDLYGNVNEWCQESFRPYPRSMGGRPVEDVEDKAVVNDSSPRTVRGGGFSDFPSYLRSAQRIGVFKPSAREDTLGFRVARTWPPGGTR